MTTRIFTDYEMDRLRANAVDNGDKLLMCTATKRVEAETVWRNIHANSSPEEWGGETFEEGQLAEVVFDVAAGDYRIVKNPAYPWRPIKPEYVYSVKISYASDMETDVVSVRATSEGEAAAKAVKKVWGNAAYYRGSYEIEEFGEIVKPAGINRESVCAGRCSISVEKTGEQP